MLWLGLLPALQVRDRRDTGGSGKPPGMDQDGDARAQGSGPAMAAVTVLSIPAQPGSRRVAGGSYAVVWLPSGGLLSSVSFRAAPLQRHETICGDSSPPFPRPIRPLHDHRLDGWRGAEPDMHAGVAGREIAAVGPHPAPDRRLSRTLDADERTEREAVRRWLLQPDLEPVTALEGLIQQQPCGPAVVRDHDV